MIVYKDNRARLKSNFVTRYLLELYRKSEFYNQPVSTFEMCSKFVSENIDDLYKKLKEYEKES